MATLIIFRGDEFDRELELGERTVRIGRSDQNDIVLPDPGKSVSRSHAELRFEQGKYVVVDLNSQNGVWAASRRVPQATLEPGVPVLLGPYRLLLKRELPPAPASTEATLVVSPPGPSPSTAATMTVPMEPAAPPPLPKPEPRPEATAVAPLPAVEPPKSPSKPPPPTEAELQKPPRKTEPPPATAKSRTAAESRTAAKRAATPTTRARPAGRRISKGLVFGGAAVLLVAVMAAAVFFTPLRNMLPGLTGGETAEQPASAAQAEPGVRQAAMDAAAAAAPAKPQAGPAVVPLPPEPTPPVRPAAPPPQSPRGGARVTARLPAVKPAVPPPPKTQPAAAAGRRGAAAVRAVETKPKPLDLAQTFGEARAALDRGDPLAAVALLDSILRVDANYPDAEALLPVARGAARTAAQLAVEAGRMAETSGDYVAAAKQYERAVQLDPQSTAAPDAMQQLRARMQNEGEDAFKRGRLHEKLGHVKEAISMYEKAIRLLPADHADAKTARDLLAALRGGVQR